MARLILGPWFSVLLGLSLAAGCGPAWGAEYALAPGQTVIGRVAYYTIKPHDNLYDVAHRFDTGFTQLMAANPGANPWLPGVGRKIILPTRYILPVAPHTGIVINLAEERLYYYPPPDRHGRHVVETFPVGIGVVGKTTPLGVTRVTAKEPHPVWIPPPSIRQEDPSLPRVVPAGPDNPLGDYALHLGWPNYLIHGTNDSDGVGLTVSHGCLHLFPEDIERLFHQVRVGTRVRTVHQPVGMTWIGDRLYIAVHPDQKQSDEIENTSKFTPKIPDDIVGVVAAMADQRHAPVNWNAVERAGIERSGLLVKVGHAAPLEAARKPSSKVSKPGALKPSYANEVSH